MVAAWLLALSITGADIALAAQGKCTENWFGTSICTSKLKSKCLGNMMRLESRTCDSPFKDVKVGAHAAPAFVDWDGDSDLDLVVGNGDGKLVYYEQLGASTSLLSSGNLNPFQDIDVGIRATPAFLDWDGDEDLDLAVGNGAGKLQYFERTNDSTLSPWTGTANPFHGINVGKDAVPTFVDWDGDGDLDLFVGCRHWHTGHQVRYYERIQNNMLLQRKGNSNPFEGMGQDPSALVFTDWNLDGNVDLIWAREWGGIEFYERLDYINLVRRDEDKHPMWGIKNISFPRPAVVDWNGDGDLDLVVGIKGGQLKYFERSEIPFFSVQKGFHNPFRDIDVGYHAIPALVDLNGDDVLDLAVGTANGEMMYFENIVFNELGEMMLSPRTGTANLFNGIDVGAKASPAFADWDGDNIVDLAVGNKDGNLECYQQAQNNSFVSVTNYSNPCQGVNVGSYSAPAFLDWDGDDDLDLVVGNHEAKLQYFERTSDKTWLRRTGAANPFHGLQILLKWEKIESIRPVFVDWDSDGDLDLVVSKYGDTGSNKVVCFKNKEKKFVRQWEDASPYKGLTFGKQNPTFGDWDGDGDLDIVVGRYDGTLYYIRDGCQHENTCTSRGQCLRSGRCMCLDGYEGAAHCAVCSPGFEVSSTEGTFFCKRCDPGKSSAFLGRPCNSCPHGKYSSARGSSSCEYCIGGSVPDDNQSNCLECDTGKYASTEMHSCNPCLPGKHSERGSTVCHNCTGGTVPDSDQSTCVGCLPGKYASAGMDSCMRCPAGRYSLTAEETCTPCKAGRYSNGESGDCTPCAEDLHAKQGSSACSTCRVLSTPSGDNSRCIWDSWLLFLMISCSGMQCYTTYIFFRRVRFSIRLVDLSFSGEGVFITTWKKHLLARGLSSIPVCISGTHHPFLDGHRFLVRSLDANRLELLDENANQIWDDLQASMGILTLPFRYELLAICLYNPVRVLLLPVPWLTTLFAKGWVVPITIILSAICSALLGILFKRLYARSLTPLQVRHRGYKRNISKENPKPVRCDPGPGRAVTLSQIRSLLLIFHDYIKDRNAYWLDANVLRPITKDAQLSFAEFAGPSPVDYFVSHFWGTRFVDFVSALERHGQHNVRRSLNTPERSIASGGLAYWVCFLSNNQWRLDEEVVAWQESSFYKALWSDTCRGTCMILDTEALPLTRAWCLFEVLQTFRREAHGGFAGLVFCTHTGVMGPLDALSENEKCYDVAIGLADRLAKLDVRDAKATVQSDEVMIKSLIEEDGGMDSMNHFIRTNMCQALAEVQKGFGERAKRLQNELAPLEQAASSLENTTHLSLCQNPPTDFTEPMAETTLPSAAPSARQAAFPDEMPAASVERVDVSTEGLVRRAKWSL